MKLKLKNINENLDLEKNVKILRIELILIKSAEIKEYVEPFLNEFEENEVLKVFFLISKLICETYQGTLDDLLYDFIKTNIENILELFKMGYCEEKEE